MSMKIIWFKEIRFISPLEPAGPIPSLIDCRGLLDKKTASRVLKYMKKGQIVFNIPSPGFDVFEPSKYSEVCSIVTDGIWVWAAELEYYLVKYQIGLPPSFVEHALKGEPLHLNATEMQDLRNWIRPPSLCQL